MNKECGRQKNNQCRQHIKPLNPHISETCNDVRKSRGPYQNSNDPGFSGGHASPCQTPRQPLATARPPTKTEGACTRKKVRAGCALATASRALAGSFANPAGLRSRVKLHPEPRLLQARNQPNFPWQTRSAYPHFGHARAACFRPTPPAMAERGL